MVKTKENQVVGEQLTHIILSTDYNTNLILPTKDGLEFIRLWTTGLEHSTSYNKPPKFGPVDKEFKLKFISEQEIKRMQITAMLEAENAEEED
jgi:hypothetical protein